MHLKRDLRLHNWLTFIAFRYLDNFLVVIYDVDLICSLWIALYSGNLSSFKLIDVLGFDLVGDFRANLYFDDFMTCSLKHCAEYMALIDVASDHISRQDSFILAIKDILGCLVLLLALCT